MAIDFMDFLKETFETPEDLDLEQVYKLAIETKAFFEALEEVLAKGDSKAKEEAITDALEIKEFLDFKAKALSEKLGFNVQQFQEMVKNPPKLDEEEREKIVDISSHLDSINKKPKLKKLKPIHLS